MSYEAYDFLKFYDGKVGGFVRGLVRELVNEFWPDVKGEAVMGYGYAVPYLSGLPEGMARAFAAMPSITGAVAWQEENGGKTCLVTEGQLPFESESFDKVLLVHGLEHAEAPDALLQEIWRVLKANGTLLIVVPNRAGLWARIDWTPFGHGSPYSRKQLGRLLRRNLFIDERDARALFLPPRRSAVLMRITYMLEYAGKILFPGLAGLYLVEARKQVYAGLPRGKKALAEGRQIFVPAATPSPV